VGAEQLAGIHSDITDPEGAISNTGMPSRWQVSTFDLTDP
jgi:hypothetical protein